MRKIMTGFAILVVAGCSNPAQEAAEQKFIEQRQQQDIAQIQKNLPEGCSIGYQGRVRLADRSEYHAPAIFMVRCDGRKVTTTNSSELAQSGKQTIELGGVTYVIEPAEQPN